MKLETAMGKEIFKAMSQIKENEYYLDIIKRTVVQTEKEETVLDFVNHVAFGLCDKAKGALKANLSASENPSLKPLIDYLDKSSNKAIDADVAQIWGSVLQNTGLNITKKGLFTSKPPFKGNAILQIIKGEIEIERDSNGDLKNIKALKNPGVMQDFWDSCYFLRLGDYFFSGVGFWVICEDDTLLRFE